MLVNNIIYNHFVKLLQEVSCGSTEIATYDENRLKNRYSNILASDETRVKLRNRFESDEGYINANFVDVNDCY